MRDPQTVQFSGRSELPKDISEQLTPFQNFVSLPQLISLIYLDTYAPNVGH